MVAPTLDLERSIVSASSGQVEIDPVLELENAFREVNVSSDEVKVKNATGEAAGDLSEASFQELAKTKSTSQLKADLKARDVDFSDCLEKGELIDRLVSCEAWRNDVQEERARQMHSRPRIVEADSLPDTCFEEFKAANNLVHQCLKLSIPAEVLGSAPGCLPQRAFLILTRGFVCRLRPCLKSFFGQWKPHGSLIRVLAVSKASRGLCRLRSCRSSRFITEAYERWGLTPSWRAER